LVGSCLWNIRVGEICCCGYCNKIANRSLESPITDGVMSPFCMAPIGLPWHFRHIIPRILLVFSLFMVFKALLRFIFYIRLTQDQDIRATIRCQKFGWAAISCTYVCQMKWFLRGIPMEGQSTFTGLAIIKLHNDFLLNDMSVGSHSTMSGLRMPQKITSVCFSVSIF
jgi:hypothetical protein